MKQVPVFDPQLNTEAPKLRTTLPSSFPELTVHNSTPSPALHPADALLVQLTLITYRGAEETPSTAWQPLSAGLPALSFDTEQAVHSITRAKNHGSKNTVPQLGDPLLVCGKRGTTAAEGQEREGEGGELANSSVGQTFLQLWFISLTTHN